MQELACGGLIFRIEYRRTADDHGPAIRVFGDVDGRRVQLLRFDCFDTDPHYHYDPTGRNVMFHLDPLTMGDPVEFSLSQIADNARAMIENAGFPEAAERVNQDELASRIGEVLDAIRREQIV